MNIEEIALRVAEQIEQRGRTYSPDHYVDVVKLVLAELSKDVEPVAFRWRKKGGTEPWKYCGSPEQLKDDDLVLTKTEAEMLFTRPIPANTAEIEQQVAEACIRACKDSYSNGDMMLDAIYDLDQGKWREYL